MTIGGSRILGYKVHKSAVPFFDVDMFQFHTDPFVVIAEGRRVVVFTVRVTVVVTVMTPEVVRVIVVAQAFLTGIWNGRMSITIGL